MEGENTNSSSQTNPNAGADAATPENPATETQKDPMEEWKSRVAYLSAEIENMRKRFVREKSDLVRFANEELIKTILPVVDNLQLAVKAAQDAEARETHPVVGKLLQGVDMTLKHFEQTLERIGVQTVSAVGETFDPQKHEAIAQSEHAEHPNDHVSAELQRGYTLHGRLIRPARVVVNKKNASN